MPGQILRPYQEAALRNVLAAYREGARSVLLVLPTGGGKTSVFSTLAVSTRNHVLVNVHRRELATQAANRFREFGADFGFIMAGEQAKPYAKIQIASVQTLVRRTLPAAGLVINDEAHLSTAKTWETILNGYPDARILGVTATPWRLGGKPLVGAYDRVVVGATPAELCAQGFLSPYVGFSYKAPDMTGVEMVGDDYNQQQSAAAMSAVVPNIVEQWLAHARDLSTVVFAVTVEHSQKLAAEFKAAGVRCEHLDGTMSIEQRRAILERVDRGVTQVLCNVGVAVEGLDIPRLKCCVLARPTKSLARAIQMMGRVRRPWNGVTARIHDHAFVIGTHGLPDQDRDYTLTAKLEAPAELSQCTECLAYFTGKQCPGCASEAPPKLLGERKIKELPDAEQFQFDSAKPAERPPNEKMHTHPNRSWDKPGQTLTGIYRGSYVEEGQYGKRRFHKVDVERPAEVRHYTAPGNAMLDKLLERVAEGRTVQITYLGEQQSGKFARKTFKVEVETLTPAPVVSE